MTINELIGNVYLIYGVIGFLILVLVLGYLHQAKKTRRFNIVSNLQFYIARQPDLPKAWIVRISGDRILGYSDKQENAIVLFSIRVRKNNKVSLFVTELEIFMDFDPREMEMSAKDIFSVLKLHLSGHFQTENQGGLM